MKPILFTGEMVRAILERRKTQTRRVIKGQPKGSFWKPEYDHDRLYFRAELKEPTLHPRKGIHPKYGRAGDKLYVRETHFRLGHWVKNGLSETGRQKWIFKADTSVELLYFDNPPRVIETAKTATGWFKRPSIFMPKWASRITLLVKDVRVERVQGINDGDAIKEGIEKDELTGWRNYGVDGWPTYYDSPIDSFRSLWDSINAKRGYSWESNPWVWVVEFKVIQ